MSDEELRDQINRIAVKIEEIEETAKKKEAYINNKICEEIDPKIGEAVLKLQDQQKIFNELIERIDGLVLEKKKLIPIIKKLEQECTNLKKEKDKMLNENLKSIAKEKKTKTKTIDKEIKVLEKELKAIHDK